MIEAVFTESAQGSMDYAKSLAKGGVIGGCTSIIILHDDGTEGTPEEIEHARREYEEQAKIRRETMLPLEPGEVFGFSMGLSYGDLNDRLGALKVLFGFWDAELESQMRERLEKVDTDLARLRKALKEVCK